MKYVFLLFFSFTTFASLFPPKPLETYNIPHLCTPSDKDFVSYRYEYKVPVCRREVSTSLKKEIFNDYGIPEADRSQYTIDHLIPLFLGGSNHKLNLWPQHKSISTSKVEGEIFRLVDSGKLHPSEALNRLMKLKYGK